MVSNKSYEFVRGLSTTMILADTLGTKKKTQVIKDIFSILQRKIYFYNKNKKIYIRFQNIYISNYRDFRTHFLTSFKNKVLEKN